MRTRESYIASVRGLAKYFKRSPDTLTEDEVQRYLLHLIEERKLAWSSVNVTVSALKFLFHVTLKRKSAEFAVPGPHQPQKLPQILSSEEVMRIIDAAANSLHYVMPADGHGIRILKIYFSVVVHDEVSNGTSEIEEGWPTLRITS